jgi:uncharacterized membrane protein YfcA
VLEVHLHAGVGHPVSLVLLALAGLFVGYFAGMFGIGGGFLLTPLLMFGFGVPAPVAVGSALSQKCGTSVASFLKYRHLKRGEPRIDLIMMGGSLIGVDAGTRLLAYWTGLGTWRVNGREIPLVNGALDVLFIVLLTGVSAYVFHDVWTARRTGPRGDRTIPGPLTRIRIPPYVDLPRVQLERVSVPVLSYTGFLLGVASGVMGIGGGVVFLPILLYGYGLSARNAAGTGILLLAATVALGTFEQALHGYVSLELALAILAGSSIGSQLGAWTTHVLPNRTLRLLFGILVVATIMMIAVDLARLVLGGA